ncbi:hypothetical protein [Caloranaerobacter ferrireducens]|uniref:hypothetical protein n=1 Tax=Caloranaerobacter ferrireducens TaxID=1323370 RepID=UPI00084D3570|nr:hypothetical protein [Caloranaerobacter ferrireducens]
MEETDLTQIENILTNMDIEITAIKQQIADMSNYIDRQVELIDKQNNIAVFLILVLLYLAFKESVKKWIR